MRFSAFVRPLAVVGLMGLATACITAAEMDQRLGVWVGRDADDMAAAWGAPAGVYMRKDGGKILSYERSVVVTTGGPFYPDAQSRSCRVDVSVDPANKITSAKWQGPADQCAQLVGNAPQ